uniref:Reverse transcriptase domain-containing protein n=1 Tax=Strongyloides venezuelensis TaxID=75913 RepID=A0A0K0FH29_STRVS
MKNLKRKDLNYTILSELIRFEINNLCSKRTNVIIDKAIKESRSMKYVFEEISRKKFNNISKECVNKTFGEIFGKEREENREIKKSKRKACGADGIFSKHPILGGRKAAEALANLFNNHGYLIPNQMNECQYQFYKPYSKFILGLYLNKKNTLNQILQLCTIIQTCRDDKKDLYAIFIDFKKAFDSVNHSWLLYSLAINDFDEELVKRIEALYRSPKATFSTGINNSNTTIEVKSGIRQSDH